MATKVETQIPAAEASGCSSTLKKKTRNLATMSKTDLISLFFVPYHVPRLEEFLYTHHNTTSTKSKKLETPEMTAIPPTSPPADSSSSSEAAASPSFPSESSTTPSASPSTPDNTEQIHAEPATDSSEDLTDPMDLSDVSMFDDDVSDNDVSDTEAAEDATWECEIVTYEDYVEEMFYSSVYQEDWSPECDERLSCGELRSFELADEYEFGLRTKAQRGTARAHARITRECKKPKVNPKRCVNYPRHKKAEERKALASRPSHRGVASYTNFGSSRSVSAWGNANEDADVQRAIAASLRSAPAPSPSRPRTRAPQPYVPAAPIRAAPAVLAVGFTQRQLDDLMNRELTPEDYEMLLRLDETVAKKTVSKDAVDDFATRAANETDVKESACTICLSEYVIGETLKTLPCGHFFHEHCVREWLSKSSVNCPIDNLPVHAT